MEASASSRTLELEDLFDATPRAIVVVPSFLTDAQRRADNSLDLRASSKATVSTTTLSQQGVSSNLRNTVYTSATAPLPVIRNEELILIRAEARWFTGAKQGAIDKGGLRHALQLSGPAWNPKRR